MIALAAVWVLVPSRFGEIWTIRLTRPSNDPLSQLAVPRPIRGKTMLKNCQLPGEASTVTAVTSSRAMPALIASRRRPSRAKSGIRKIGVTLREAAMAMTAPPR